MQWATIPPPREEGLPSSVDYVDATYALRSALADALESLDQLVSALEPVSFAGEEGIDVARDLVLANLSWYLLWFFDRAVSMDEPGDRLPHLLADDARAPVKEFVHAKEFFPFFEYLDLCLALVASSFWIISMGDTPHEVAVPIQASLLPIAAQNAMGMLHWIGSHSEALEHAAFHMRLIAAQKFANALESLSGKPLDYMPVAGSPSLGLFEKLASSHPSIHEKFGSRVPLEMEKQLSHILRALGFLVSSTRPGRRRVDVIAASWASPKYTFMVDAKSTKRSYYLPVSDQRAIQEYIAAYRNSSHTQPDLRFALVVSSSPASTLEPKLDNLSAQLGIPVRFISAKNLANIIRGASHPVPASLFLNSILGGPRVLDAEWTEAFVKQSNDQSKSYTDAIEAIYSQAFPTLG